MAPRAQGRTRRCHCASAASAIFLAGAARAAAEPSPGVLLLQKGLVAGTMLSTREDPTPGMAELSRQMQDLKDLVLSLQRSIDEKVSSCCGGCGGTSPPKTRPGLCAAFGDPHFTTFDGAHTILLRDMSMWLVKSDSVWVQGLARTAYGNLMGIAVGGTFMENHTLVIYNSTMDDGSPKTGLTVLFDGQPILANLDDKGNAEFEFPLLLWAARRSDFSPSVHDREILDMSPGIEWDVGSWASRFSDAPAAGIFVLKFPMGVELTVTGVDFMSAVVKMPRLGAQSGYCGNFDGNADDEFDPPPEGSVPPLLVPVSGRPKGEGLEPVSDDSNLFLRFPSTEALVRRKGEGVGEAGRAEASLQACSEDQLTEAKGKCQEIRDVGMWRACLEDYCLQRGAPVARDMAAAEGLAEKVNTDGVAAPLGHGRCVDGNAAKFRVLRTAGLRSAEACLGYLLEVSTIPGILGAQLQVGGTCELVVDPALDFASAGLAEPPEGAWANPVVVSPSGGAEGVAFVAGVDDDRSWSCWRMNH